MRDAMGGISSNVGDQLSWARFHMSDGSSPKGTPVLSPALLRQMQEPTVACPGNDLGDAIGISWLLRDIEGVRVVSHGGDMTGQHSIFEMVPERGFAITSLTNCGPNGPEFQRSNHALGVPGISRHRDQRPAARSARG
jgi:CubicO group peptidase (beta-lactamase class C family)